MSEWTNREAMNGTAEEGHCAKRPDRRKKGCAAQ